MISSCLYLFMHQHLQRVHLPCHWLCYITFTHKKLGERISFNWNEMCCVTSENIDQTKTLKKKNGFCTLHLQRSLTRWSVTMMMQARFANARRSSAEFSQLCVWRHHPYSPKTARVIVCVHVMHERIPSPRQVSDWLILQLRRGFQYDPIFGDYRCGFEGYAGFQARNSANCRNLHTTRTI